MGWEARAVSRIVHFLRGGNSVEVVGGRGSGRTTVLERSRDRLLLEGWEIVMARGNAAFAAQPLSAARLAGLVSSEEPRLASAVESGLAAVDERARQASTALIVDDWEDVDEASRGLFVAAARRSGAPLLVSRLRARRSGSASLPGFVVELGPLGYGELAGVVAEALGGPVEPATMSRVYAESGGIPGVARSIVVAAAAEGGLASGDEGWAAAGELWSPSLASAVERQLEVLDAEERRALEALALAGAVDPEAACGLVGAGAVERLEEAGLLRPHVSGARALLAITPPLVVEHVRRAPTASRRIGAGEAGAGAGRPLSSSAAASISLSVSTPVSPAGSAAEDAVLARLVQEGRRERFLAARVGWERSRTLDSALRLLEAMIESGSPGVLVDAHIDAASALPGSEDAYTAWAILLARRAVCAGGDAEAAMAAVAALREVRAAARGASAALLDAALVELECLAGTVPEDAAERLPAGDGLPPRARAVQLRARARAEIALGAFAAAESTIARLLAVEDGPSAEEVAALRAWSLLGRGDTDGAIAVAGAGIASARAALDAALLRECASPLGHALFLQGRYREVEALLDTVSALGEPSAVAAPEALGPACLAVVVAVRRGRRKAAESCERRLAAMPLATGPLPGADKRWAAVQRAASAQDRPRAAALAREIAADLRDRNARFAAALFELDALELDPDRERLAEARPGLERVEGALVAAHLAALEAALARDPEALSAAADALARAGLNGLALIALRDLRELRTAAGDARAAEEAECRQRALLARLPLAPDMVRYAAATIELTDRERQVAAHVTRGLTNAEIADSLVLSVRTIESHVRQIMRKTGTERRAELKAALGSLDVDH